MPPIQAVIFDLDDTLYPEKSYTFSGYRAVANQFAKILGDPDESVPRMCELFDSPDRAKVFNVILDEASAENPAMLVPKMVEAFRRHSPQIKLHKDADAALTHLRSGYKLGIISDGFLIAQQNKVDVLNLPKRVDEVILTDTFGRAFWKPHPRAFEEIVKRLCVQHHECAYVADNLAKDFVAPNTLGWHSVFIDRPQSIHRDNPAPQDGKPQHTITSLNQLSDVLKEVA